MIIQVGKAKLFSMVIKMQIVLFLILLFSNAGSCQTISDCSKMKYDTINARFITELNANFLYYKSVDAIVQNNLIFPSCNAKLSPSALYNSDTVLLTSCEMDIQSCRFRRCVNEKSVSKFYSSFEEGLLDQSEIRKLKRSTYTTKNGAKYVAFKARIIVLNIGSGTLKVPKAYSTMPGASNENWGEKTYSNLFLIVRIDEFEYDKIKR